MEPSKNNSESQKRPKDTSGAKTPPDTLLEAAVGIMRIVIIANSQLWEIIHSKAGKKLAEYCRILGEVNEVSAMCTNFMERITNDYARYSTTQRKQIRDIALPLQGLMMRLGRFETKVKLTGQIVDEYQAEMRNYVTSFKNCSESLAAVTCMEDVAQIQIPGFNLVQTTVFSQIAEIAREWDAMKLKDKIDHLIRNLDLDNFKI